MKNWAMFIVGSALLLGCSIEVTEGGDDWEEHEENDRTPSERAADVCDPYCIELIVCGALSSSAFSSCRDLCFDRFEDDEMGVTEGSACIEAAQCDAESASECEGDPLPDILEGPSSPSEPGDGGSSGGDYSERGFLPAPRR